MYQIIQMKKEDIPQAVRIWHWQFEKYCHHPSFPDFWNGGKETIEAYLGQQVDQNQAIVAKSGSDIAGYMSWMNVEFHKERTAFCPTVGHAAMEENKENIYQAMYDVSSQEWVQDNRFNHQWMIFYEDTRLMELLYELGFGSYVVDACQKVRENMLRTDCIFKITRATTEDIEAIIKLENEMKQYFFASPIFLKQKELSRDQISQTINQNTVFTLWDSDNLIGVIGLSLNKEWHFELLTTRESGYICRPGVFIKPEYRRKGAGTALLNAVFNYCIKVGKPYVHVSFETANPNANQFWPRYFKPSIRSVRRTVNKDANDSTL